MALDGIPTRKKQEMVKNRRKILTETLVVSDGGLKPSTVRELVLKYWAIIIIVTNHS